MNEKAKEFGTLKTQTCALHSKFKHKAVKYIVDFTSLVVLLTFNTEGFYLKACLVIVRADEHYLDVLLHALHVVVELGQVRGE